MDPWTTDDGYSEYTFRTAASDERGHAEYLKIRLPPELLARMAQIRERIPAYHTLSDIGRDGIFHRLHWLEKHIDDPELAEAIRRELALVELREAVVKANKQGATFEKLKGDMESFVHRNRVDRPEYVRRQLDEFRDRADLLDEPFRSEAMRLIDDYLNSI